MSNDHSIIILRSEENKVLLGKVSDLNKRFVKNMKPSYDDKEVTDVHRTSLMSYGRKDPGTKFSGK